METRLLVTGEGPLVVVRTPPHSGSYHILGNQQPEDEPNSCTPQGREDMRLDHSSTRRLEDLQPRDLISRFVFLILSFASSTLLLLLTRNSTINSTNLCTGPWEPCFAEARHPWAAFQATVTDLVSRGQDQEALVRVDTKWWREGHQAQTTWPSPRQYRCRGQSSPLWSLCHFSLAVRTVQRSFP